MSEIDLGGHLLVGKGESKVRLIKMLGLSAIAALTAMALVGATSASANFNTSLCKVHTSLTCPAGSVWDKGELIHLTLLGGEPNVGRLLSSLATVLCLGVLVSAEALGLTEKPTPLPVHATVTYSNCGTNTTHTNCNVREVQVEHEGGVKLPALFHLLKTGLDAGTLLGLSGKAFVECKDIFGFIEIECEYEASGVTFSGGGLHLTANKTPVELISGGGFCPEESKIDGLVGTLPDDPKTEKNEATPAHILQ